MVRAVVTGAGGFVGRHLVRRLIADGHEVTTFHRGGPASYQNCSAGVLRHVNGDVRDPAQLAEAITGQVDVVYHLAALVGVSHYLRRPLDVIETNVNGTRNVLQLAERSCAKVVVVSTSEIFGKNPDVPWKEDADRILGSTTTMRWSYASSKAVAEHLTFAFIGEYGMRATVVRYFNVYGPLQHPSFVVSRSIHRALNGRPLEVFGDGAQARTFTFVDDIVDATVQAGTSSKADGEIFNLGSYEETSIRGLMELVAELTDSESSIVTVDANRRFGGNYQDFDRLVPDATKARSVLGWQCRTTLRDGVARTIDWARVNPWWCGLPDNHPN